MLEIINFNSKEFKYRFEYDNSILIYNAKTGNLYLIKNNAKECFLEVIKNNCVSTEGYKKYLDFF